MHLQRLENENETIQLDDASSVPAGDLAKSIPSNSPRFTFYAYDHGQPEASLGMSTTAMRLIDNSHPCSCFHL